MFVHHDSTAKIIDEEFDNELLTEEPQEDDGINDNGKEKATNMSQDEVLTAIQTLMNKASTHMEDSMS